MCNRDIRPPKSLITLRCMHFLSFAQRVDRGKGELVNKTANKIVKCNFTPFLARKSWRILSDTCPCSLRVSHNNLTPFNNTDHLQVKISDHIWIKHYLIKTIECIPTENTEPKHKNQILKLLYDQIKIWESGFGF